MLAVDIFDTGSDKVLILPFVALPILLAADSSSLVFLTPDIFSSQLVNVINSVLSEDILIYFSGAYVFCSGLSLGIFRAQRWIQGLEDDEVYDKEDFMEKRGRVWGSLLYEALNITLAISLLIIILLSLILLNSPENAFSSSQAYLVGSISGLLMITSSIGIIVQNFLSSLEERYNLK